MPGNNNQKVQSATERLAKVPVVRSAWAMFSVFYMDTKCKHPNLISVCEGLERSVTTIVAPVIGKLEPQISIVNNIACKGLDWLETTFPVIHTPTEEIVATAKNKMSKLQVVVCIAATGTVDCVKLTASWLMYRLQQGSDGQAAQAPVQAAIGVACLGLDSALTASEALVDHMLPAPQGEDEAHFLEGFDTSTPTRGFSVRLVALTTKLYRRTRLMVGSRIQIRQVTTTVLRDLHTSCVTLVESVQGLPQYVQHQLVTALFFLCQMYYLGCPPVQPQQFNRDTSDVSEAETSARKRVIQLNPHAGPVSLHLRSPSMAVMERGCGVNGCTHR